MSYDENRISDLIDGGLKQRGKTTPTQYDSKAIEEAIDLLNDHIKGAEHFTSYPQDFLRGTAPGTNRDIKELISISERHRQKAERLKTVVVYLEQLK